MLLILVGKFNEIVKIGEVIKDGLKTRKSFDESSRLLKRKRENVSSDSFDLSKKSKSLASLIGRKPLPSKTYHLAPQNLYTIKPNYQNTPPNHPNHQAPLPYYSNAQLNYQTAFLNYQNAPNGYQAHNTKNSKYQHLFTKIS